MEAASSSKQSLDPYSVCVKTYDQLNKGQWSVPLTRVAPPPQRLRRSTQTPSHTDKRIILPAHAILKEQEQQLYCGHWFVPLFSEEAEQQIREKSPARKTVQLPVYESNMENESREKECNRKRQLTDSCDKKKNRKRQAGRRHESESDKENKSCDKPNKEQQAVRRSVSEGVSETKSREKERKKIRKALRRPVFESDSETDSCDKERKKLSQFRSKVVRRFVPESDTDDEGSDEQEKIQQAVRRSVSESESEDERREEKQKKMRQAVRRSANESDSGNESGDKECNRKRQALRVSAYESDTEDESHNKVHSKKRKTMRRRKYERDPENKGCTKKRSPPKPNTKGNFEYFAERLLPQILQDNPGFNKMEAVGLAYCMWEDMDEMDRSLHVPRIAIGSDYARFQTPSTTTPARR